MTMSVPSSPHPRNHARSTSLPAAVLMQDMSENAVLKPEQAFYDAEAQKISDEIDEELKVCASALYLHSLFLPRTTRENPKHGVMQSVRPSKVRVLGLLSHSFLCTHIQVQ